MMGMDNTDSICWDPHKMLGSILQYARIVTKYVNFHLSYYEDQARAHTGLMTWPRHNILCVYLLV